MYYLCGHYRVFAAQEHEPGCADYVSEQVESTQAAFEAGASICHALVRNEDETPSSDPEKFAALKEGLQKHCPGMIIQFSTGGRSGAGESAAACCRFARIWPADSRVK